MKSPSSSTIVLALAGLLLVGLGGYFIFLRPPLLPEDLRYMGVSLSDVKSAIPGLFPWLQKVFWVIGGYMLATGLLTVYLALTSFREKTAGVWIVVAVSGVASIGWMAVVNFMIASDFKWLILAFFLPWLIALGLHWKEMMHQTIPGDTSGS